MVFLCCLLFKMEDSKEEVEEDKALMEQAIALSLSGESSDQGGEINSPFNVEPKSNQWQGPTTLFLGQLQEMGFSKNACIKGLYYTQNHSVDEAASWILSHAHLEDIDEPLDIRAKPDLEVMMSSDKKHQNICKMVFVVNTELGMGSGKIAAQVGHASIALYRTMLSEEEHLSHIMLQWEDHGELKVVVKGHNAAHLIDLERQAKKEQLLTYLVYDAGRTQISPGSVTVLGIFGTTDAVNKVTGSLKLL